MTPVAAIALLVGVITSAMSAVINNPRWSSMTKRAVVIAVSVLLGSITAVLSGSIAGVPATIVDMLGRAVVIIAIVFVSSQGVYQLCYHPVKKLEDATSGNPTQ